MIQKTARSIDSFIAFMPNSPADQEELLKEESLLSHLIETSSTITPGGGRVPNFFLK